MNGEDYALTRMFSSDANLSERLLWVITRSIEQYSTWNARLGELNAILQLSLPHTLKVLLQILAFFGFCFYISTVFNLNSSKRHIRTFLLAVLLVLTLVPSFELFFWGTVNAGYLQPILLSFPALYFYNSEKKLLEVQRTSLLTLCSLCLLLLGMSFENVAPALIIYMLLSLFLYGKMREAKLYIPILFLSLGWFYLMMAPSTSFRQAYYHDLFGSDYSSISYIIKRVVNVIYVFFEYCWLLFLAFLTSAYFLRNKVKSKFEIILPVVLSTVIVGSCILSPYTEPRAFLLAWIIMLSFVCRALSICLNEMNEAFSRKIIVVLSGISFSIMLYTFSVYSDFSAQVKFRDKSILTQNNCNGFQLREIESNAPYRIINNREEWVLASLGHMSNYYGCSLVK